MMTRFALSVAVMCAFALTANAGPFGIFGNKRNSSGGGCANGSCASASSATYSSQSFSTVTRNVLPTYSVVRSAPVVVAAPAVVNAPPVVVAPRQLGMPEAILTTEPKFVPSKITFNGVEYFKH